MHFRFSDITKHVTLKTLCFEDNVVYPNNQLEAEIKKYGHHLHIDVLLLIRVIQTWQTWDKEILLNIKSGLEDKEGNLFQARPNTPASN